MKKILITGASGFIGSFLVEEAVRRDWQTWAGIRQSSSKEYLQDAKIQFINLNFSNKEQLKNQIENHVAQFGKWDYIIHNAGVTKCLKTSQFDTINYHFTRNLIESLQETGNIPEKFILMSSLSAHHPQANIVYGKSKLKAEQFLESQTDFPYIILCPTGVYGPRDKDYYLVLKTIQSGFDLAVGFEPQKLTFIYVKDLVKIAFSVLESPIKNKRYFISDGNVYSDAEYTQIAKKALGKKQVIRLKIPLFILKTISGLAEDFSKLTKKTSTLNRDKYEIMKQRDWSCDTLPLQTDLNFKADYNLEQGIQESVAWYRVNEWL
jgi:nucleoside-diphosphate-sugar epimerase